MRISVFFILVMGFSSLHANELQGSNCATLRYKVIKDEKLISWVEPICSESLLEVTGLRVGDRIEGKGFQQGMIRSLKSDPFGIEIVKEKNKEIFEVALKDKSDLPTEKRFQELDLVINQACEKSLLNPEHYRLKILYPHVDSEIDLGKRLANELAPKAKADCVREVRLMLANQLNGSEPLRGMLVKSVLSEAKDNSQRLLRYHPEESGCKIIKNRLFYTSRKNHNNSTLRCSTWIPESY